MPPKRRPNNNKKKKGRRSTEPPSTVAPARIVAARNSETTASAAALMMSGGACLHGGSPHQLELMLDADDPVIRALKILKENFWDLHPMDLAEEMSKECCPCCLGEPLIKALVGEGTSCLLEGSKYCLEQQEHAALVYAQVIHLLEHWTKLRGLNSGSGELTLEQKRFAAQSLSDLMLNLDSRRKLVRFYRKRIPCGCLAEIRKEERQAGNTGVCSGCCDDVEEGQLFVCGRCSLAKYCCKECQVQDWPQHKGTCSFWSEFQHGLAEEEAAEQHDACVNNDVKQSPC